MKLKRIISFGLAAVLSCGLLAGCGNLSNDEDTIDTFIEAKNYSFPVACDTESNISNLYPSAGIPYTVIVGKDGLVTETFLGAKDADSQYTKLRRALQEAYEAN